MDGKLYAVINNDNGGIVSLNFDDDLIPAALFMKESHAYDCVIRSGNNNLRVIEVMVFREKETRK